MSVRNDSNNYSPPKIIQTFESDLQSIMMFLAGKNDYVIGQCPDEELLSMWFGSATNAPLFISKEEAEVLIKQGQKLRLWGENRASLNLFGLIESARKWNNRDLLSRRTSVYIEDTLKGLFTLESSIPIGFDSEVLCVPDISKLELELKKRVEQNKIVVLKTLWSASGRGVRFFSPEECNKAIVFGEQSISRDGAIVLETYLNKKNELSFLFERKDGKTVFTAANLYRSSPRGTFGYELSGKSFWQEVDTVLPFSWKESCATMLAKAIDITLEESGYEGPIGIDSLVYSDNNGQIKIRPCMEANLRLCMGNIAQRVASHFSSECKLEWTIGHFKEGEWDRICNREKELHPLHITDDGLIDSGFIRLTSAGNNKQFGAYGYASKSKNGTG